MTSRFLPVIALITSCFPAVVLGQPRFHVGVEAGVPFTDTLSSSFYSSSNAARSSVDSYHSVTKRLLIGPAFRVDLPKGFGLEFDAIYQRVDYDHLTVSSTPSSPTSTLFYSRSFQQTSANRWQFPMLVQYNWTLSKTKLFTEVGPSISWIGNSQGTSQSIGISGGTTVSSSQNISGGGGTLAGFTAGAGVDLPLLHHHLRPEFRFSHWFSPLSGSTTGVLALVPVSGFIVAGSAGSAFHTNQNEASFLLGLSF